MRPRLELPLKSSINAPEMLICVTYVAPALAANLEELCKLQ